MLKTDQKSVFGILILSLGLASASPAFAGGVTPHPEWHFPPHGGPVLQGPMRMHSPWISNRPVPLLMPIVLSHAVTLDLTPKQDNALKTWMGKQHQAFPAWIHSMRHNNQALRKALLQGEFGATIAPLKQAVIQDGKKRLDQGIAQVHFLHKILTPVQWQKVVKIAEAATPWKVGWQR